MYLVTLALFVFGIYFLYQANKIKITKQRLYDYKVNNEEKKE